MKKCPDCKTPMEGRKENYRYTESGLPYVTLANVEVRQCPRCGARMVAIPRVEELHRVIAMAVISRSARLAGVEIRFLRKYLGLSGVDFAERMGVAPETVSKWENSKQPIGSQADRLLRLMVAHGTPVDSYPLEKLAEVSEREESPAPLQLRVNDDGWHTAAA